jgi:two-component system chemotaxis response regulator CheB
MIRVLVVDDSATARALLVSVLSSDPELQVVEARDGLEAVALTQQLRPDVITMAIHMPRMDGFAATKEIMITAPTPIVIATGSTLASEVTTALQALRAGAMTVVQKPHGPGAPTFEESAANLIATVKAMSRVKVVHHWRSLAEPQTRGRAERETRRATGLAAGPQQAIAIAASTGGPPALQALLSGLPPDFAVPILVVQHIAVGFTQGLASWLSSACDLRVKVAEHGEALLAHTVYLAPDDRHLGASAKGTVLLSATPPVGGFRPAGAFLFDSVARAFGAGTVAVVLTGMGEDGVAGLPAVRQAGGRTIVQDEASCVVFGMPAAAIAAGLADEVLPLERIGPRLLQLVKGP